MLLDELLFVQVVVLPSVYSQGGVSGVLASIVYGYVLVGRKNSMCDPVEVQEASASLRNQLVSTGQYAMAGSDMMDWFSGKGRQRSIFTLTTGGGVDVECFLETDKKFHWRVDDLVEGKVIDGNFDNSDPYVQRKHVKCQL